jgi:hypothetical protein
MPHMASRNGFKLPNNSPYPFRKNVGPLSISTAIAMIVAVFGVYVLATDAVQRPTREIVLRRLFGARRRIRPRATGMDCDESGRRAAHLAEQP